MSLLNPPFWVFLFLFSYSIPASPHAVCNMLSGIGRNRFPSDTGEAEGKKKTSLTPGSTGTSPDANSAIAHFAAATRSPRAFPTPRLARCMAVAGPGPDYGGHAAPNSGKGATGSATIAVWIRRATRVLGGGIVAAGEA